MNEEQRKVNAIARKLWSTLIETGERNLATAFTVSPKLTMTKLELSSWLGKNVFLGASLWDEKYKFESIDFWNSVIEYYWGFRTKYLTDVYDCDNFAFSFSSDMARIFGINTAGVASGEVYKKDGSFLDRHAYNIILAIDNGVLKPYLFEPMKNIITEWKGQKTTLGDWQYVVQWQEFF